MNNNRSKGKKRRRKKQRNDGKNILLVFYFNEMNFGICQDIWKTKIRKIENQENKKSGK